MQLEDSMYKITQPSFVNDNETFRPAKRVGIRAHPSDGEAVLYDEQTKTTFHLNETAFFIWDACDGIRTLCDLAALLIERYEVDQAAGQNDVNQIVAFLAEARLVTAEVLVGTLVE
jgi:Coenzyme PQQ synthesis protein D (PqqD)